MPTSPPAYFVHPGPSLYKLQVCLEKARQWGMGQQGEVGEGLVSMKAVLLDNILLFQDSSYFSQKVKL